MFLRATRIGFLAPALAASLALLVPAQAVAFSLSGMPGQGAQPLRYSLAPGSIGWDPPRRFFGPPARRMLLAQEEGAVPGEGAAGEPAEASLQAMLAGDPLAIAPLEIPEPGLGQYAIDTFLVTFVIFAWKRALNVSAARRIVIENYDNFGDTLRASPPINDLNNWSTNWIGHPILGAYFYLFFRSRGHTRLAAGVETFIVSSLHEYAIETSFEPASGIDLIMTPALGVPIGMLADELSLQWVRSDSRAVRFFGYVLNPMLTMPWARWRRHIHYDPSRDSFAVNVEWWF